MMMTGSVSSKPWEKVQKYSREEKKIQAKILKNMDAESLLERAAGILQCRVKDFHQAARISKSDKEKRDLLIYILWEMCLFRIRR